MAELPTRMAIGNDEAAVSLRPVIGQLLAERGTEVDFFGPADANEKVDYPDIAEQVALKVADGTYPKAVLLCGTGIGMAIAANKVPGIRAANVSDAFSAERAAASNDAQILTLGARTVGPELAKYLVNTWLDADFNQAHSGPKVDKINALDAKYDK
jgi:ribose 5-phosphate isomerase B